MDKFFQTIENRKGFITLLITVLTLIYYVIVTQSNFEQKINQNNIENQKTNILINNMQNDINKRFENKVDYIVLNLIIKQLDDIKADLKYLRDKK